MVTQVIAKTALRILLCMCNVRAPDRKTQTHHRAVPVQNNGYFAIMSNQTRLKGGSARATTDPLRLAPQSPGLALRSPAHPSLRGLPNAGLMSPTPHGCAPPAPSQHRCQLSFSDA